MKTSKTFWNKTLSSLQDFIVEPLTIYTIIIAFFISVFIILEAGYPRFVIWTSGKGFYWFQEYFPIFATAGDKEFSRGFVEWFGTFYGFLLPLLLVRAWEQLDSADREFDREADAIKVLLEDIMLLEDKDFLLFKLKMVCRLHLYCRHVSKRYKIEHLPANSYLKLHGDNILQGVRAGYKKLIYRGGGERASHLEPVTTELLERLNDAIDTRGDRISVFSQRLFESLRMVSIVTSIMWLIPFYFLPFQTGVFGALLKLGVTFLILFVLTIIDDLDHPFTGKFKIRTASWLEVYKESESSLSNLQKTYNLREVERKSYTTDKTEEKEIIYPFKKATTDSHGVLELLLTGILSFIYILLVNPKHDRKK